MLVRPSVRQLWLNPINWKWPPDFQPPVSLLTNCGGCVFCCHRREWLAVRVGGGETLGQCHWCQHRCGGTLDCPGKLKQSGLFIQSQALRAGAESSTRSHGRLWLTAGKRREPGIFMTHNCFHRRRVIDANSNYENTEDWQKHKRYLKMCHTWSDQRCRI